MKYNKNNPFPWISLFAIILLAMNLRGPLTSIGPLTSAIAEDTSLTKGSIGLLTTIPLIVFSLSSLISSRVIGMLGINKSIFVGLFMIIIGEVIRSYTNIIGLYIGTLIISVGIGLGNILILSKVKESFPRHSGIMISIYTSTMTLMAGVGAWASAMLVSEYDWGWRETLAIWVGVALAGILIWSTQIWKIHKGPNYRNNFKTPIKALLKSRIIRKIIIHIGLQSLLFYCMTAWLPEILQSHSVDLDKIGNLMFLLQILNGIAGFSIPILVKKTKKPIPLIVILCILLFLGISGLLVGSHPFFPTINVILIAVGLGSAFTMGISLINHSTSNSSESSTIYGLALSLGYLLAAIGPFILGFTYDQSGSWVISLIILLFVVLSIAINGINKDFKTIKFN